MNRTTAAVLLVPAVLLTACPDKEPEVPPVEEQAPSVTEELATSELPPPKESVCDCTCEGEGCRCAPLTWRVGCLCHDEEMKDCACDCKGEIIVSVDEVSTEAVAQTAPGLRIEAPGNDKLAEEVPPPPPPPPPDAS